VPRLEPLEQRLVLSNYWVSPSGNDNNAGTQQSPWQTLQHAADSVVAGDTVDALPGDYSGFNITKSGTASAPITFSAQPGAIINSPLSSSGVYYGINSSGNSYLTIEGFTFTPGASNPEWYSAIRLSGIAPGGPVPNWVTGNIIKNNTCEMRVVNQSPTPDGFGIYASWQNGLQVLNNTVSGTFDSGIYVANSSTNYTIEGNTVYNCGGNGIHNNGDASQGGPGINTNALIEDNVIYGCGFASGGQSISCDGVQNSTIEQNLIYDAYGKGISLYQVTAADGCKNDIIVNNTVLTASDGGAALRMVDNSTGNTVLNNILYSANPTSGSIDIESSDMVGLTSDYNILTPIVFSDGSSIGFSGWQAYGFDLHSSDTATPAEMFVNPSANNYQLSSTSPAIGAGTSTDALSTDIVGNPRPSGKGYDIGAYEYEAGAQSPPPVTQSPPPVTQSPPPVTQESSIWSSSASPQNANENDNQPVEVGVRFSSDVDGYVTGLKFYKGSGNTGTHVGHLWDSAGNLLATATFTGETATGWQQVNFSTPVAITAGTTYVASYLAPNGYYADDQNYFTSQYNSGSLHVPANGGVYAYGGAGSFPTQVWNASNYWVDVVFTTAL
jgi:parallel beta-helix repeat protein